MDLMWELKLMNKVSTNFAFQRRGGALEHYAFKPLAVVCCGVGVSSVGEHAGRMTQGGRFPDHYSRTGSPRPPLSTKRRDRGEAEEKP